MNTLQQRHLANLGQRADKLVTWSSQFRLVSHSGSAEGAEGLSARCCEVLARLRLETQDIQMQSPLRLGEAPVGSRLRAGDPLALSPLTHSHLVVTST